VTDQEETPMSQLPNITRTALPNGKNRYEVDGEVHTKASGRVYTAASVYRRNEVSEWEASVGRAVGDLIVFLHAREDLAAKGSPDGNRIAATGTWSRVPGVVTITEA
jgi:hypothetical protein